MTRGFASSSAIAAQEGASNSASRLLIAAANAFCELGFEAASFSIVADRAEVSKSLLSYHFPTKASLGVGVLNLAYSDGSYMGATIPRLLGLRGIIGSSTAVAEAIVHDPVAKAAILLQRVPDMQKCRTPQQYIGWIARIADRLNEARLDGVLNAHTDLGREARRIVSAFVGIIETAMTFGDFMTLVEDVHESVVLHLRSLCLDQESFFVAPITPSLPYP